MNTGLKLLATIAAIQFVATGAMATTKFAAKNGTATGASCGSNSNTGDATNGPCTTITEAYANAKTGGGPVARVIIVSSGFFQEPTITLDYSGGASEIRVSGGLLPGIATSGTGDTLAVNTPNDVRIYDLVISGSSTAGTHGINVSQVNTLELHRVEMRGIQGNAVFFAPTTCPNPNTALLIADSNLAGSQTGLVRIVPGSNCTVGTAIKNSQLHHSTGYGVRTESSATTSANPVKTIISTSILANFSTGAVVSWSLGGTGTLARTIVENTSVVNAQNGILAIGPNSQVVLSNTIVAGNTTGLSYQGGQILSFGNNGIFGNGTNGADPSPLTPK